MASDDCSDTRRKSVDRKADDVSAGRWTSLAARVTFGHIYIEQLRVQRQVRNHVAGRAFSDYGDDSDTDMHEMLDVAMASVDVDDYLQHLHKGGGAVSEHQDGVTGVPIDEGISIAFVPARRGGS